MTRTGGSIERVATAFVMATGDADMHNAVSQRMAEWCFRVLPNDSDRLK